MEKKEEPRPASEPDQKAGSRLYPPRPSFSAFLREVRFATVVGFSVLLFFLVFGLFEIVASVLDERLSMSQLRVMHLSRGVVTVGVLLAWVAWALYETRDRFLQVVHQHDGLHRRILEASGDAVFISSPDDRLLFLNTAAERLLAGDAKQGVRTGGPVPDLVARFLDPGYTNRETLEWADPAGRHRFLSGTRAELLDPGGQVESRLLIVRDLTEGSIRLAQMERSERLASIGHMAAGVAHEIGNPLTAISSMVQLLQRQTAEEPHGRTLTQIRGHIDRIATIVRDLADISRPRPEQVIDIALPDLVENVFGLLRHDARCRGVRFLMEAREEPTALVVSAVYDRLYQVLLNLILNAVDAMPPRGGEAGARCEVSVLMERAGERVRMRIVDTGKGIPASVQRRIFEPFFTTKEVGQGTGLGLYVSHQLAEKCGGSIRLEESRPGHTCFLIDLPVRAQASEPIRAAIPMQRVRAEAEVGP